MEWRHGIREWVWNGDMIREWVWNGDMELESGYGMGTDLGRGQVPLSRSSLTNFTSTSSHLSNKAFSASWEVESRERVWA